MDEFVFLLTLHILLLLTFVKIVPFFRRSLKILAESYAIKGLCLENLGIEGGSKFKQAERTTEMVCFQFAIL